MGQRGRPNGSADLAPMIRGAAMRALKYNENRGKGLTLILADSFVNKPLETLTALAKFNPSQVKLDITAKVEISEIIALAHQRQAELKDITPPVIEDKVQDNNSEPLESQAQPSVIEGQTPSEGAPKVPDDQVPPAA